MIATVLLGLAVAGEAYAINRTALLHQYRMPAHAELRVDVAGAPVIGDPSTPLSGLLFVEFGCPYCAEAYRRARGLVRRYPEKFHFFVKQFPLDRTCNPKLPATTHRGSCEAAVASAAATLGGKAVGSTGGGHGLGGGFFAAWVGAAWSNAGVFAGCGAEVFVAAGEALITGAGGGVVFCPLPLPPLAEQASTPATSGPINRQKRLELILFLQSMRGRKLLSACRNRD